MFSYHNWTYSISSFFGILTWSKRYLYLKIWYFWGLLGLGLGKMTQGSKWTQILTYHKNPIPFRFLVPFFLKNAFWRPFKAQWHRKTRENNPPGTLGGGVEIWPFWALFRALPQVLDFAILSHFGTKISRPRCVYDQNHIGTFFEGYFLGYHLIYVLGPI